MQEGSPHVLRAAGRFPLFSYLHETPTQFKLSVPKINRSPISKLKTPATLRSVMRRDASNTALAPQTGCACENAHIAHNQQAALALHIKHSMRHATGAQQS